MAPSIPQGKELPLLTSSAADFSLFADSEAALRQDPKALLSASSASPVAASPEPTAALSLSLPKRATGTIPRSKSISGKALVQQKRASVIGRSKAMQSTWAKKQKQREERKRLLEKLQVVKVSLQDEKQREKHRLQQRRETRKINEEKNRIVQKITDTRKIKKMSRKQLRLISKA